MRLTINNKAVFLDDADWERLPKKGWRVVQRKHLSYVVRDVGNNQILMHREILGISNAGRSVLVDHIDGNGLNNRRSNIRICNSSQNMCNSRSFRGTSKYKGVSLHRDGKWMAKLRFNGDVFYLGLFKDEKKAALAYNREAIKRFGEFAKVNNI